MQDLYSRVRQLQRPRLLVQAARFGLDEFRRDRHLRRLLATDVIPGPAAALVQLLEIERIEDMARKERSAHYSVARHVETLIAIMGETRLLRATSRPECATAAMSGPSEAADMAHSAQPT